MKWKKFSDELPSEYIVVLAISKYDIFLCHQDEFHMYFVCQCGMRYSFRINDPFTVDGAAIAYWMDIPKIPKE